MCVRGTWSVYNIICMDGCTYILYSKCRMVLIRYLEYGLLERSFTRQLNIIRHIANKTNIAKYVIIVSIIQYHTIPEHLHTSYPVVPSPFPLWLSTLASYDKLIWGALIAGETTVAPPCFFLFSSALNLFALLCACCSAVTGGEGSVRGWWRLL